MGQCLLESVRQLGIEHQGSKLLLDALLGCLLGSLSGAVAGAALGASVDRAGGAGRHVRGPALVEQHLDRPLHRREAVHGRVVLGEVADDAAQHPDDVFASFGVAAEPEKVVGGATGKILAGALRLDVAERRAQQGDGRDRPLGKHANVLGTLPLLQADGAHVVRRGDAREPARHDRIAAGIAAGGRDERPQHHRPRLQLAVDPRRRGRWRRHLAGDVVLAAGDKLAAKLFTLVRA